MNIVTGEIMRDSSINVNDALKIGQNQRERFESKWPDSFKVRISKEVMTMTKGRKAVVVDGVRIIDTSIFYARAMGLHASGRGDFDIASMLSYELAPIATSMFDEKGNFRTSTKADLKKALQVETQSRNSDTRLICGYFLDGCAVLWAVEWPTKGRPTVQDYIDAFRKHIVQRYLKVANVFLIFDK